MSILTAKGCLKKMVSKLDSPVSYLLPIGDEELPLNELLGQKIKLQFSGNIFCQYCGRATKKSFNQGYCFPCMKKLARCDICIVSPEKCHFEQGTCREPEWGLQHCMQSHIVYLSNTSGAKVGITRQSQLPTRWIDQGAIQALPVLRVDNRLLSGLVEHELKPFIADKTNWRTMLKGEVEQLNLAEVRDALLSKFKQATRGLQNRFGEESMVFLEAEKSVTIDYPVTKYPEKVSSLNFDKTSVVSGVLEGIKGQYLIFDNGVLNIRKFTSYEIEFNV